MTSYDEAGVNIEKGDACSRIAYAAAKGTFPGRKGLIGEPAILDGGFSGLLDMGEFYLVQNDDGVGSKAVVAQGMKRFDTLGYDLLAMVADDAICMGAEVISVSNTIDIEKVDDAVIRPLMEGLGKACLEQKIVIPGGEIAELSSQVKGFAWNATAVGIVEKHKFIDGSKIAKGDVILGLRSAGFRSNGFSLVRHILTEKYGTGWMHVDYGDGRTWGEVVLTPSIIYHRGLLEILGAYKEERLVDVHGIVHITGGGLEGNVCRVLRDGLQAEWTDLWTAHEPMLRLMEIGNVSKEEAMKTWNMGTGMVLFVPEAEVAKALEHLGRHFQVKVVGVVR